MTPQAGTQKDTTLADEPGFSEEGLDKLHNKCVTLIQDAAASGRLPKKPHLWMLLFRWVEWGNEEDVREYVKGLVEINEGLLDFLVGFLTQVYSTSEDYKVIRRSTIEKLIDVGLVEKRAREVNQHQRQALDPQ